MGFFSNLFGGGSKPDLSGINNAAATNAALSAEMLDWYKKTYESEAPQRQAAIDRANAVSDAQLQTMQRQQQIADDYYSYQTDTYRPLERGLVADAQNYDTSARRESEANAAAADVQGQIAAQRQAGARAQASMGVNPNSGRAQALDAQSSIAGAAASAGAMNAARNRVETQGYARRMDAANLGRNLPSNQATSAQIGLSAGDAAARTGAMPVGINAQGSQLMGQGYGSTIAGNQSAGNLYGQAAQIEAGNAAGNQAGLGRLAGLALAAYGIYSSSKGVKHDKRATSASAALDGIKALPVEQWKYKPGEGDGGTHIGPYAEDVQREFGDEAAPGGKAINLREMSAKNALAIKELSARLARLNGELEAAR